jgi:hypothetical protein
LELELYYENSIIEPLGIEQYSSAFFSANSYTPTFKEGEYESISISGKAILII